MVRVRWYGRRSFAALRVAPEQPVHLECAKSLMAGMFGQLASEKLAAPDRGRPNLDLARIARRDLLLVDPRSGQLRRVDQDAGLAEHLGIL